MQKEKSSILFILPNKSMETSAVLQSQVLEPAIVLAQQDYKITILCSEKRAPGKLAYAQRLQRHGIALELITRHKLFWRLISMVLCANRICRQQKIDLLYFRNIWGGLVASCVLGKQVESLYDLRAVVAEESAYRNNRKFPGFYFLKIVERFLLRKADRISVVSQNLKRYVDEIVSDKTIQVIPSAVNPQKVYYSPEDRIAIRKHYAIGLDDLVLVYIGSISKWQHLDLIVQIYDRLLASHEKIWLMVITRDAQQVRQMVTDQGVDGDHIILVDHLPHDQVYRYLSAADLGFLIRNRHILNLVSSPIKFSEYLICGLPVILTPWVGDFSGYVQENQVGLVIEPDDPQLEEEIVDFIERYTQEPDHYRERCIAFANQQLSWCSLLTNLEALYRSN
jgi:glycosyltransferase involved in cell wall biosynthesis